MVYLLMAMVFVLSSCDVHEWPEPQTGARLNLHLVYDTNLPKWIHPYSERSADTDNSSVVPKGLMQYIVRLYPVNSEGTPSYQYVQEYLFTQDVSQGYNLNTSIDVDPGDYQIMVWSQLLQTENDRPFYDAVSFIEIKLQNHVANTDYRDAFKGKKDISITPSLVAQEPQDIVVEMKRPLAKFEFITTDLQEFVLKEISRSQQVSNRSLRALYDEIMRNLSDYNIHFYYVGYMPNAFSLFTDRPVDSSTGNKFNSTLTKLSDEEASLGFDYVFTNGKETNVTVQIAVTDAEGIQLSLTKPIVVPIKRSYHTLVKGSFLMATASGGISIDPSYDGDFNIHLRDEEDQTDYSDYEIDIEE